MKTNVGSTDRLVRIAVGVALVVVAITTKLYWLLALAAIALVTGFMRFCPLWLVLRINTLKKAVGGGK